MVRFRAYYKGEMWYDWGHNSELGKLFFLHYCPQSNSNKPDLDYSIPDIKAFGEIHFNQFTGIFDKNGRSIFVDDYVKYLGKRDVVTFDKDSGQYMAGSINLISLLMTVDGNIHEK
jgi:hypothetical protein